MAKSGGGTGNQSQAGHNVTVADAGNTHGTANAQATPATTETNEAPHTALGVGSPSSTAQVQTFFAEAEESKTTAVQTVDPATTINNATPSEITLTINVENLAVNGNGQAAAIGYGNTGNPSAGFETAVQNTTISAGTEISFGNQGNVGAGLLTVGYGNLGTVNAGLLTVAYGNQSAPSAGLPTQVTESVTAPTETTPTVTTVEALHTPVFIPDADLSLSKTLETSGTHYRGEQVTFQIQIANTGPDTAQNVVVSDTSFSDLSNVIFGAAPIGTTITGNDWNVGSLASGTTETISVTGTIAHTGTFSNTAEATTTTFQSNDPSGVAITATANSTAVGDADLTLSKTLQTTGTLYDGEQVTFQIQVGNLGPSTAQNVVVSDSSFSDLSGITLSSASAGTISGNNWNISSLSSGATDTITVSGTITNAGVFSNTASAITSTYQATDPSGTAITSTAGGSTIADADLSIVKTLAGPSTITLNGQQVNDYYDGEKVTFTVQVSNSGPDAAQGVIVTDSTFSNLNPSSIQFSSLPSGASVNGDVINLGSLASGGIDTFTVTGNIATGTAGGTFANTAGVTTTTYQATDPSGAALTSTATSSAPVIADADLSIVKTLAGPSAITLNGQSVNDYYDGEKVTFTVQVSNSGPDAAQGVIVTDSTFSNLNPSSIQFSSLPNGATVSGDVINLGSLASGGIDTFTVTGNIATGTAGGTFANTAGVTTTTYQATDPSGAALTSTAASNAPVVADADLSIVKTLAGPSAITLNGQSVNDYYDGEKVTFTVQVSNSGPDAAQGVIVTDSTFSNLNPSSIQFSSLPSGATVSGDVINLGSLASGGIDTFTVTGNIATGTAGGTFANTAGVTTTTYQATDPSGAALTSTAASSAPVVADADLSIVKTLAGPSAITLNGQSVNDYYDGEKVTFTVQVSNSGPDAAQGVIVTDSTFSNLNPSSIQFSSLPSGASVSGDVINLGSLASGGIDTFTVTGNIATGTTGGTFANTAGVTTTTYQATDPSGATLTSTAASSAPVVADADLSIVKTLAGPSAITLNGQQVNDYYDGEKVTFTVQVSNSGPDAAQGVIVTDSTFSNLNPSSIQFSSLPTGATVSGDVINLGSLASGGIDTFTVTGNIATGTAGGTFSNTAGVTTTTYQATDPSGATLTSTAASSAPVVADADLSIVKTLAGPSAITLNGQSVNDYYDGEKVTFTVQVSNSGPDAAQGVIVTDSTFSNLNPSSIQFSSLPSGASVSGDVINLGSLASGGIDTFTVTGNIATGTAGGTFSNTAGVTTTTYQATDPTGATLTSTAASTAPVIADADLSIVKTLTAAGNITVNGSSEQAYYDGEQVTFTVKVSNSGPDAASSIVVSDNTFSNLSNVQFSSPSAGTLSGGNWDISSLASGTSDTVTVTGTIVAGTAGGTFSNTAGVTTTTYQATDPSGAALTSTAASTVPVVADADLSIVKTLAGPSAITLNGQQVNDYYDGEKVTFTVQVSNSGPDAAQGVIVTDSTFSNLNPSSIQFSSLPSGASVSGDVINLGSLASGGIDTFTVTGNIATGTAGGTFSNTAGVTTTTYQATDPSGATLTSTAASTAPVIADADLSIVKTLAGPSAITLNGQQVNDYYDGEKVTFTVQVSNSGPDAAQGVIVTDSTFSNLNPSSIQFSSLPTGATVSGDVINLGSLASGGIDTFTVTGNIATGTAGSTFANTAGVTTTTYQATDPTGAALTSTATSSAPVIADADLSIVKTLAGPSAITLNGQSVNDYYDGEKVTFTVQVSNSGPDAAQGVIVTDSTFSNLNPSSIQFSSLPSGASVSGDVINLGSLASGGIDTFTVTGNIATGTAGSTFANTAGVTTTTYQATDPTGAALTSTATSSAPVVADADLSIVKTLAGPSAITLNGQSVNDYYDGEKVTFTVQVSNSGPDAAQGVIVTDSTFSNLNPSSIQFSSLPSGASVSGDVINLGSLASGGIDTFTVTGNIATGTAGSTFANTAGVTTTTYQATDPSGAALTSTATSSAPVVADADLSIVKTLAGPSAITLNGQSVNDYYDGEKVTFTVQVSNSGPDAAQGVIVTDSTFSNLNPSSIQFSSLPSGASVSGDVINLGSLASGGIDTFTVTGNIATGTAGSTFANTAGVTTTTYQATDPTGAALTSTATSTAPVVADADLSIVKTLAGPSAITLNGQQVNDYYDGEKVTFTVQVSNSGPDAAQGVIVTDSTFSNLNPSSIQFSSLPSGASVSGDVINLGSLASGGIDTFTVTGNIATGTAGSTFANTAGVTTTTYQATDPTGAALTSTATSTAPVIADADLSIVKTLAGPSAITLNGQQVNDYYDGEKVTFTVQVSNSGPDAAQGVIVTDSTFSNLNPSSIQFSSLPSGASVSGDVINLGSLASGGIDTFTVTGNIATGTAGSTFANTAGVTTTTYQASDPTGAALTSTATSSAPVIADADLSIVKTLAGPSAITLNGQQVNDYYDGEKVTFTVQVSNSGPDAAQGVIVTDSTFSNLNPSSIQFSSLPTGATVSGDVINLGSLASGGIDTFTVTGNIATGTAGSTFANTAGVTTTTYQASDPTGAALTSTATSTAPVIADADLSIVKTLTAAGNITVNGSSEQAYYDGEQVTFTVKVSNSGPDAASSIVVADNTFSNLSNVQFSSPSAGTLSGGNWDISSLASGTSDTVTVTGTIVAGTAGGTFSNTAGVTTTTYQATDPTGAALTSTATSLSPVVADADLSIVKTLTAAGNITVNGSSEQAYYDGEQVTFTVKVSNSGPDAASSIVVSDNTFSNLSNVQFSSPSAGTLSGGNWDISSLASGTSDTVTVTGTIVAGTAGGTFSNTAGVTTTTYQATDPTGAALTSTATSTAPVVADADLSIVKTLAGPSAITLNGQQVNDYYDGEKVTFTVQVSNSGPDAAQGVIVTDSTFSNLNPSSIQFSSLPSGASVSGDVINLGSLASGGIDTFTVTGNIATGTAGSTFANTAGVTTTTYQATDPTGAALTSTATSSAPVIADADLSIVKTLAGPSAITLNGQQVNDYYDGEKVTFTVQVSNSGPDAAQGVIVTDSTFSNLNPSSIQFSSLPSGASVSGDVINLGSLASGGIDTFTVTGNIATGTAGSTFANTAGVTTTTYQATDPTGAALTSTATSTAPVIADADLSIIKTLAGPSAITLNGQQVNDYYDGEKVTFTVQVSNSGPDAAQGVIVTDSTFSNLNPSSIQFSSLPSGATVSGDVINLGSLASGGIDTFTVTGNIATGTAGSTFANTAGVTTTTYQATDPTGAALTSTATSSAPVVADADLSIVKTLAGPSAITLNGQQVNDYYDGEKVTFTVQVSNSGPDAAQGVIVTDSTFSNLNPSSIQFSSLPNGATVSGDVINLGSLASGGIDTFTVTGNIATGTAGSTFANTAGVTTTTYQASDPTGATLTSTATSTAPVVADADLSIVKTLAGPSAITLNGQQVNDYYDGEKVTFTVQVSNSGPDAAQGVIVTDSTFSNLNPSSIQFSSLPNGATVSGDVINLGSLASGGIDTFTVTGNIATGTAGSTFANTAGVTTTTYQASDPTGATLTSTATSTAPVIADADLSIVKTLTAAGNITVNGSSEQAYYDGEQVTFTVKVSNSGPDAASSIVVADNTFSNLSNVQFSSPSAGTLSGGNWDISSLASGTSDTITVTGTIVAGTAGGTFSNTAGVTTTTYQATDPTGAALTSTVTSLSPVVADADLSIVKTLTAAGNITVNGSSEQAYYDGEQVTFTVKVSNSGPDAASSIVVSDNTFSNLSNVQFSSPSAGTLSGGNWDISSLASGTSDTVTVTGTIVAGTAGGAFSNTAGVTTTTYQATDPTGAALTSTATSLSPVVADADLSITKTLTAAGNITVHGSSEQAYYDGEQVTFTVKVSNSGPDAASSIVVSDNTFSNLSNVQFSSPSAGTLSGGNWDISSLASGTSDTVTVTGTIVAGTAGGTFSNTAGVTTTTYQATDPTGAALTSTVTSLSPVVADADLSIVKTLTAAGNITVNGSSEQAYYDGEQVTFTVKVSNSGPDAASSIVVADNTFSNLSNVQFSSPSAGTLSGGNWDISSLASGTSDTVTVTGTIVAGTAGGTFSNTAGVTTTTYQATDPTGATLTSTATSLSPVVADADLSIVKTLTAAGNITVNGSSEQAYYDGEQVTFTVKVSNSGPDAASSIVVSDNTFSNLSNVQFSSPSAGTLSGGNWDISSLASGTSDTVTVTGTIIAGTAGETFSNTASVTTATYQATDPTGAALTSTATSLSPVVATADLVLTKILTTTGTIYDGEHVTFQIQVQNTGPDAAQNVVVSDTTFTDLSSVTLSSASAGTISGSNWDISSLASGATDTITVNAVISNSGSFSNTATATTSTYDLNSSPSSTASGSAEASCDLAVTIKNSSAVPGASDTYTLTITNNGPDTVSSFTLGNTLPAAFLNAAYTASSGSFNSSTGAWTGVSLASGQSITLSIAGTLNSSATGSLTDSATVTAPSTMIDTNLNNNNATNTVTLTPQANLAISITPSETQFIPGDAETYTITLKNTGPSVATNVSMLDTLAAQGFLNVSSPNLPSGVTFNAATDTWTIGTLAVGATDTFQLTGTIPTGATGSSYIDQVSASASDASSVSAQSSIIPTGIIIAEPDVDTVSAVIGGTAVGGNVITAVDTSPSPGEALQADQIDAYGGTHIVSISYGNETSSFSIPSDVFTNSQGSYITLAGEYGTLDMYSNGNYTYTVTSLPASTGVGTYTDGSVAPTSSGSVTEADWSGAGLYAFNFGSPYESSNGLLNLALANDNANISYNTGGIGINGYDGSDSNSQPVAQLKYDPIYDQSQALAIDLHTNVTQATVTVSNLFQNEATGEQGLWQAFTSSGVEIGEGLLNSSTINYGSSEDVGSAKIEVLGANGQAISFEYLVFTALPYPNANPANNPTTDSSDYFVSAITYTTAPTTPNLQDVFGYTIADSNNDQSSTTLTVYGQTADLAAAIAASNQTPSPGGNETYTITVTNSGPGTVTSLALTDTTINGTNSLNQFVTYFTNPVMNTSAGTYNSTTGAWTGLDLASGQSVTMTISGTINSAATGSLINTVTVVDTTSGITDPITTNNSAESSLTLVPQATLALSMTASEGAVTLTPGTTETYTLTLTNNGPSAASNVTVTDTLPSSGLSNISSPNLPSGVTFNSSTDTWTVGTLASGATDTIYLSATVASSISASTLVNQATASASDASNVTASNTANVLHNSLSISQTDSAATIEPANSTSSDETYTITVTNTSGATATNVNVSDLLPTGISFVSDTASTGTYSSTSGNWTIASLAAGASATLNLTGEVNTLGTFTNTATITSESQFNLNATNNIATASVSSVEQHFNALISDANNSGSAVVLEASIVNHTTPWDSAFAPIVLPAGGGQTYISIATGFNITAGTDYTVGLELAHGSSGQNISINGFIPLYTDVINPTSLSGETDSRYGSTSNWSGGHSNMSLISGSDEGITAVITAGASSSSQGSIVQSASSGTTSNTISDSSSTVNFDYGTGTGSNSFTVTGNSAGDLLDANSTSSHHYAIYGGSGNDVIVYNSEDASISGGTGTAPTWNTLVLYGNDSISLTTSSGTTSATSTGGISGGTHISNMEILNISGYAVNGSGAPIINANNTVSSGSNTVTLNADDVLNMSTDTFANLTSTDSAFNQIAGGTGVSASDKVMIINGASTNTVNFAEGNWVSAGTVTDSNGAQYAAYTHAGSSISGTALVLVNTDITHITGHT